MNEDKVDEGSHLLLKTLLVEVGLESEAHESMSAMIISSPGTCVMVKDYHIVHKRNLWTGSGSFSRFFVLQRGTSGLWSVLMLNHGPVRWSESRSHAQVKVSTSSV